MNLDTRARGASPLREGRRIVAKGRCIDLVDKNTEERDGLVVRVGPEIRKDFEDECGRDGGEKASLWHGLARVQHLNGMATHKYQGCIQIIVVFLHEVLIVFLSRLVVVLVKLGAEVLLGGQRTLPLTG